MYRCRECLEELETIGRDYKHLEINGRRTTMRKQLDPTTDLNHDSKYEVISHPYWDCMCVTYAEAVYEDEV